MCLNKLPVRKVSSFLYLSMNFLIFFRLFCKKAVVGMEPVIIDPLALVLLRVWLLFSYKETYVRKKKKKKIHPWSFDRWRRQNAGAHESERYFGGSFWRENYSGNRGTTQRFYMFRIFCTDVVVAGQFLQSILHEGKFLLNILTPLSYFFIQCRSFGFNNFFPLAADGVIGVCARKKKPQGKIQTREPDCRLNRRW